VSAERNHRVGTTLHEAIVELLFCKEYICHAWLRANVTLRTDFSTYDCFGNIFPDAKGIRVSPSTVLNLIETFGTLYESRALTLHYV